MNIGFVPESTILFLKTPAQSVKIQEQVRSENTTKSVQKHHLTRGIDSSDKFGIYIDFFYIVLGCVFLTYFWPQRSRYFDIWTLKIAQKSPFKLSTEKYTKNGQNPNIRNYQKKNF